MKRFFLGIVVGLLIGAATGAILLATSGVIARRNDATIEPDVVTRWWPALNGPGVRVEPISTHRDLENKLIIARVHVDSTRADVATFRKVVDVKGRALTLYVTADADASTHRSDVTVTYLLFHNFDE